MGELYARQARREYLSVEIFLSESRFCEPCSARLFVTFSGPGSGTANIVDQFPERMKAITLQNPPYIDGVK